MILQWNKWIRDLFYLTVVSELHNSWLHFSTDILPARPPFCPLSIRFRLLAHCQSTSERFSCQPAYIHCMRYNSRTTLRNGLSLTLLVSIAFSFLLPLCCCDYPFTIPFPPIVHPLRCFSLSVYRLPLPAIPMPNRNLKRFLLTVKS